MKHFDQLASPVTNPKKASDFSDMRIGEFCPVVILRVISKPFRVRSNPMTIPTRHPAFVLSILDVIGYGSEPEVCRVNTPTVIPSGAVMANDKARWDLTFMKFPRSAMCELHALMFTSDPNKPIASCEMCCPLPNPTSIFCGFKERIKPLFKGLAFALGALRSCCKLHRKLFLSYVAPGVVVYLDGPGHYGL